MTLGRLFFDRSKLKLQWLSESIKSTDLHGLSSYTCTVWGSRINGQCLIGTYNINGLVLTFNLYYWLFYQKITFNGQKLKNMRWLVYKSFVWNLIVQSSIFIKLKCSTLPKACVLKITIEFTSINIFYYYMCPLNSANLPLFAGDILYIYYMMAREIWNFIPSRTIIFPKGNKIFLGE